MPKISNQLFRWAVTIQKDGKIEEGDLPPKALVEETLRLWNAKHWVYQHERASRDHWQMSIQLNSKKRCGWLLRNLPEGMDRTWVTVKPSASTGAFNYCMKEDTRVAGPYSDKPIYMGQDLAVMNNPLPWQQEVIDMVNQPPDDRTVVWIHEPVGNVGKSKLLKYLRWKNLACRVPIGTAGQLRSAMIAKGAHRCYVVDFPRVLGKEDAVADIFSALEELKNGWVETAFYGKPAELLMEPPHVIVMSNDKPNLKLASKDRWKVFQLKEGSLTALAL